MDFPEQFISAARDRLSPEVFSEIWQLAEHHQKRNRDKGVMCGIGPGSFKGRGIPMTKEALEDLRARLRAAHFSGQKLYEGEIECERRQVHEITAFRLTIGGKKVRVRYDVTGGILYSLQLANRDRISRQRFRTDRDQLDDRRSRKSVKLETRRMIEAAMTGREAAL